MEGKKPYSSTLDGHCCLSSGPRGVALIPTFAVTTDADGVVVNLYDAGTAKLNLRDGTPVTLTTETRYPSDGRSGWSWTRRAKDLRGEGENPGLVRGVHRCRVNSKN